MNVLDSQRVQARLRAAVQQRVEVGTAVISDRRNLGRLLDLLANLLLPGNELHGDAVQDLP